MPYWIWSLLFTALVAPSVAASAAPDAAALIAANTFQLDFKNATISGPGADRLLSDTSNAQFVLVGEDHYERQTPIFTAALFRALRDRHGFRHLVVEQDPIAIEDSLSPGNRGKASKLGELARRYPTLFEFASDQDLALLAEVGRLEGGDTAICGLEQATGAVRYLDELIGLARTKEARTATKSLRELAAKLDHAPKYSVNFLIDAGTRKRLADLRRLLAPPPGGRADRLLAGLEKSAEIFGYYRRAEAGEPVGLFNNTVREALFKKNFLECYRKASHTEKRPKALFKFGLNHMYRGRNETQAFPIGNFAHEFAISNGMEAYGIAIAAIPEGKYNELPEFLRMLLPQPNVHSALVDLRALRPFQYQLRKKIGAEEVEPFLALINGFDAIVILPGAQPAEMKLSGLQHE